MDVDETVKEDEKKDEDKKSKTDEVKKPTEEKKSESLEKPKPEPEATFEILSNPARVMPSQLRVIQMVDKSRYEPIKDISIGGIILMKDLKTSEPEELVEPVQAGGPKMEEEKEPDPPESFEYIE